MKDQVTRMLFRKNIILTRTLLPLTLAATLLAGGVGAALAATSAPPPPTLVPYTVNAVAGFPLLTGSQSSVASGYLGEGVPATPTPAHPGQAAMLNGPYSMTVDSVGNVYISDTGNDIIREVNYQTGLITTIAGVPPKGCTSSGACSIRTTGCSSGVAASGNPIGSHVEGIAVDAYGNIYFDDNTTGTVSIIYRGGAQVAAFITLVNPGSVAKSGGQVQEGYVYLVAGSISTTSCGATTGNNDNLLAFTDTSTTAGTAGAELKSPTMLSLDSAGNIYISDTGNFTTRVINTQATAQTFFQYTVPPGYIRSITDCSSALTTPCPTGTTTSTAYTGINGPANAIVFNSQYKYSTTDAYGNVYQGNGTGSSTGAPGIYSNVAYAGGPAITNLLTAEAPSLASYYGPGNTTVTAGGSPAELPLQYGNDYITIGNPAISSSLPSNFPDVLASQNEDFDIRPADMRVDSFGNYYYLDTHYPELSRIDPYTSLATMLMWWKGRAFGNIAPINTSFPSFSNPYYCVYGSTSVGLTTAWTQGPQTYDPEGDGCPALLAYMGGATTSGADTALDGLGNLYYSDSPNQIVRELPVGTQFAATAVGSSVTQAIQVHFNSQNGPQLNGNSIPDSGDTDNSQSTSFSVATGDSDFSIDTTTPEFPYGALLGSGSASGNQTTTPNFKMYAGLPSCTQLGVYPTATSVQDWDCLVYVKFSPQASGARQGTLVVTTAPTTANPNGLVYTFGLTGNGTGGQLAIDGGTATPVAATGLGQAAAVAVSPTGTMYIADPTNSQIVVMPAGGGKQTTIGTGLKNPMGVALDSAGNVYISDTGNNRVLKVNPTTNVQTVLGNNVWIPGATCDGTNKAADCPSAGLANEPGASVTGTTAPPQYQFKGPQGIAVDVWNNVYVADTGNAAVVEIPSNIQLGGAVQLLKYPGAPKFVNPVAIAVDAQGNVYVADTKNATGQIVELPPGGGDLVTPQTGLFPVAVRTGALKSPNGVAVDGAGNVYVADNGTNQVIEFPSAGTAVTLNFTGLNNPAGLALDPSGNLYVSDAGNSRVLFDNRQNPLVNFGTVPQDQTSASQVPLTVTNIGSQSVTLISPLTAAISTNPSGNTAFTINNNSCAAGAMVSGSTCTLTAQFVPTSDGAQGENASVNGGPQIIQLLANGEQPLANIVLSASYSGGTTPTAGATATITATVTQPHISGDTPSGTVTFTYAIDANAPKYSCGSGGTATVPLVGGVATYALPTLAQGLNYTINATFNPSGSDTLDSGASATPLVIQVPGVSVTVTANSVSYTYGQAVPALTGTVTPAPPSGVTYSFTSNATSSSPVGTYPIQVAFSGGNYCSYGFPAAFTSTGAPAVVTENPAPLTYTISPVTTLYGAPNVNYNASAVVTGAVNGDTFSATYTPANSSVLNVAGSPYVVTPTVTGADVGDYKVTAPTSTLTVTQAPSGVAVGAAQTAVANTAAGVASATFAVAVNTTVPEGIGIPTGSVTVMDNFTPLSLSGTGTAVPSCSVLFVGTTANGSAAVNNVAGTFGLATGQAVTGTGIPSGTTISAINGSTITLSANATQSLNAVILTAASGSSSCNTPIVVSLSAGTVTFTPSGPTITGSNGPQTGMHQYSFVYSGDGNFLPSMVAPSLTSAACSPTAITSNCLLIDTPDFTVSSTTGVVNIIPGVTPSGDGLPSAPNQNTAAPETAIINISGVLGFAGTISVTCTTQNPSYVSCSMTPPQVTLTASGSGTSTASILSVSTPATLPLGFFNSAQVRTSASRTALAILPFGVLAFCVRRRRRLSKALWVLIAAAVIGAGMQGCGGNQVSFYTPVPTGPQTVTVTGTFTPASGTATVRTFVVPISIN